MCFSPWRCVVCLFCITAGNLVRGNPVDPPQPAALIRNEVSVRLRLGLKDKTATDWSGSAKVSLGRLMSIDHWRLQRGETFTATVGRPSRGNGPRLWGENPVYIGETGAILRLADTGPDTHLEISTPQGNFVSPWPASPPAGRSFSSRGRSKPSGSPIRRTL